MCEGLEVKHSRKEPPSTEREFQVEDKQVKGTEAEDS